MSFPVGGCMFNGQSYSRDRDSCTCAVARQYIARFAPCKFNYLTLVFGIVSEY